MANRYPIDGYLQTDLNANSKSVTSLKTAQFISSGVSVIGETKHVFLSVRTDEIAGSGLQLDPYDASTQLKLDAILADNTKCPPNTCIHFLPGTFLTKGAVCKSGWSWFLTPETTLRMDVITPADVAILFGSSAHVLSILGKTTSTLVEDVVVDGGIWDLNMQNQTQTLCPSAIQLVADGFVARNMKVINWGVTSGVEEFVVGTFTNGSRDGRIHKKGILYENLQFTQPASGVVNVGTISLMNPCGGQNVTTGASLSNGWFEGVTVRDCLLYDITITDAITVAGINLGGWVQGFHGHGNRFINFSGTVALNCYYWDTGSGQDIKLENDQFINIKNGISFIGGTGYVRSNIEIHHEMFNTTNGSIGITDQNLLTGNLTISDCIIIDPAHVGGIGVTDIQGVRVRNNVVNTNGFEIYHNGDGTHASVIWERFNNRKLDGTLIDIADNSGFARSGANTDITSIQGDIRDSNGRLSLSRLAAANAINYLVAANSAIATPVGLQAGGTDTNISISIVAKGTGNVNLIGNRAVFAPIGANGTVELPSSSDAAAPNSSFYYSTTQSYPCFKDSGGTVRILKSAVAGATIDVTALVLKGDGAGNAIAATLGTDYLSPASNLNGSNVSSGTVANARLTAAVQRLVAATTTVTGATPAIDWSLTTSFKITLSANATFTFSNATDGWDVTVAITNTASNYSVTWPVSIRWVGGTYPTQTLGAFTDLYGFKLIGTQLYGAVLQQMS